VCILRGQVGMRDGEWVQVLNCEYNLSLLGRKLYSLCCRGLGS